MATSARLHQSRQLFRRAAFPLQPLWREEAAVVSSTPCQDKLKPERPYRTRTFVIALAQQVPRRPNGTWSGGKKRDYGNLLCDAFAGLSVSLRLMTWSTRSLNDVTGRDSTPATLQSRPQTYPCRSIAVQTTQPTVNAPPPVPTNTFKLLREWRRETQEIPIYINRRVEGKLAKISALVGFVVLQMLLAGGFVRHAKEKDPETDTYRPASLLTRNALFVGFTTTAAAMVVAMRFYASRTVRRIALLPGAERVVVQTVNVPLLSTSSQKTFSVANLWTRKRAYENSGARTGEGVYLMNSVGTPYLLKYKDGLFAPEFDEIFYRPRPEQQR